MVMGVVERGEAARSYKPPQALRVACLAHPPHAPRPPHALHAPPPRSSRSPRPPPCRTTIPSKHTCTPAHLGTNTLTEN
ncbi:hypothetical protein HF086_013679 [Spodoptera exigua]|uniref:Uncharacterized protein n=1 Tax=Spodoptera exigua TaxID=7107 RepID=A0A922MKP9_SPOEX|nr:hypothetical protein HF086_013679 [Spodoptera exigua]